MKNAIVLTLLVAMTFGLMSCVMVSTPVYGGLFTQTKGAVSGVDNTVGQSKVGKAEAQGIIVVGTGDASIKTAMENGGITKIHHVDHESFSVLGVYAKYTTIVYGE